MEIDEDRFSYLEDSYSSSAIDKEESDNATMDEGQAHESEGN